MSKLTNAFQIINRMVEDGIIRKYAVTGAVAALNYTEPTVTEDLDVLISFDELESGSTGIATLEPLISYLSGLGYSKFEKEGIVVEGWPVQFLPVANDLDAEGLDRAVNVEVEGESGSAPIEVRILTAEHIVATALSLGRPKDRERVLRFVEEKVVDFEVLRDVLKRHGLLETWAKFRNQLGLPDFDEST
jgi:hypothetical protein